MENREENIDSEEITFLEEKPEEKEQSDFGVFKILIADDEEEVHSVTHLIFHDFSFFNKRLEILDAYSGAEAIGILEKNPDMAVVFLDVVMEDDHSGLKVVEYLRNTLENHMTRIILRTGQPGEAPEESVIRDYDINDYRLKTELTSRRLLTTMYTTLRNYMDIQRLDSHRKGLEKIISASATLFKKKSLDEFLQSILEELANFQYGNESMVFMSREKKTVSGIISKKEGSESLIIAATGKYAGYMGRHLKDVAELSHLNKYLNRSQSEYEGYIQELDKGILLMGHTPNLTRNFIYIEGNPGYFDVGLINLFLDNFSKALDNFIMSSLLQDSQEKIVYALAETVDSHFYEAGDHVKRISSMMANFALKLHFSFQEAEMIRLASTMHDVGKIMIPFYILKKSGHLNHKEFETIKSHPLKGYEILGNSNLPIVRQAAEIALNHHEKFDGTGYPEGKKGKNIPLTGRMMAIIDVFDSLTHKRYYKDAVGKNEALRIMQEEMTGHFDPDLLDDFIRYLEEII